MAAAITSHGNRLHMLREARPCHDRCIQPNGSPISMRSHGAPISVTAHITFWTFDGMSRPHTFGMHFRSPSFRDPAVAGRELAGAWLEGPTAHRLAADWRRGDLDVIALAGMHRRNSHTCRAPNYRPPSAPPASHPAAAPTGRRPPAAWCRPAWRTISRAHPRHAPRRTSGLHPAPRCARAASHPSSR